MSYEAPEIFEIGDAAELTFGGCGCWTDSDTEYGEEDIIAYNTDDSVEI